MGMLDGLLGNIGSLAEKLGVPADKAEGFAASLQEKLGGEGDKMQAIQDLAAEHGISVDKIKDMLGGEGEGSIFSKLSGLVDKDGDGNPINDLTNMAKGLFGSKE
ncbi:MAG: hypothetical protein RL481_2044 [Pseudomonadota bacterium]|jgi:hypothetical protein